MKLYFARAELLLHQVEGEYVLEMAGKVIGRFKNEKKSVAAYNRVRRKLEEEMPPAEMSDEDRRALLEKHLADNLVGHNSWQTPRKKPGRSRTFG
jgi:hypothetical protein